MQLQKFNSLHSLYDYFQSEQICREYLELFRLPYQKLIEDEKQQPIQWFNAFPNNRQVEGKQGTISFPDADATGNVQQ